MTALKWIAVAAVGLLATAAAAWLWGRQRWEGLTRELLRQLEAARTAPSPARYDATRELAALPPPVQRYFRAALSDGAPIVSAATITQAGRFNLSERGEQWVPFTATQRIVARRPGFVWDARMPMMPALVVHVHDAYVAGGGLLHAALLGAVTIADLRGGGEVARGELMRWLAEAPWVPTALLPSQGVLWEPIDERSARASVADGGVAAQLTFVFGADGLIESVIAGARGRMVGGSIVPTPWQGRWADYAWRDGMRVPTSGEVAWLLPPEQGGRRSYWHGTVASIAWELAP